MEQRLTLPAAPDGSTLSLRVNVRRWCDLLFHSPDATQTVLGGDTVDTVAGSLRTGLERCLAQDPADQERFFLLLMNTYVSGWFHREDGVRLRFKADKGGPVHTLNLPENQAKDWIGRLSAFLIECASANPAKPPRGN